MKPFQHFQAFTVKANGLANRIVTDIWVCEGFDPAHPPDPLPKLVRTKALWDTGATKSVISAPLAQALGLKPVGATNVNHAGGMSVSPTYLVNFRLPHQVGVAGILVTEFPGAPDMDAIVGMDVICLGDLALTNVSGQTWMSFRMPSCEAVDFVHDAHRIKFAGASRNDPCPCGSTKPDGSPLKFKHCHGK